MHMKPEIVEGDWYRVETSDGTCWVSDEVMGSSVEDLMEFEDYVEGIPQEYEKKHGFGARLSAPGTMDKTNWSVFENEEQAVSHLCEMYELCACPECGALVEYDELDKKCSECGASLENAA